PHTSATTAPKDRSGSSRSRVSTASKCGIRVTPPASSGDSLGSRSASAWRSAADRTGTATWRSGILTRRWAAWKYHWSGLKSWKSVAKKRHEKPSRIPVRTSHERASGNRQQSARIHRRRVGWQDLRPDRRTEDQTGRAGVLSRQQHPWLKPPTLRRARRDSEIPKCGHPTFRRQPRRRGRSREL